MRNKKSSYRFVLMLVLVLALAAFPASVGANHSWGDYHWARTSNPFTIKVIDSMTTVWDGNLNVAISDWNASSVMDVVKEAGNSSLITRWRCAAVVGKVRACNYTYGTNGWLGVAQIWVSGSHITQGTAKMNDSYFNTAQYNTPAWRQLVICQEVAHTFGLGHQDENFDNPNLGTCMDYTRDPLSNQHPNQHDFDQLVTIYTHLDSTTTVGAMPPGFANADVHAVENWGTKVRESADGRSALYVRDFGNGFKIFTFVFWAE